MKFNPQLKLELAKLQRIQRGQEVRSEQAAEPPNERPLPPSPNAHHREKVAGGDVLWKPVDRTAAMLVAKAPWWAHPPPTALTPITEPPPKTKKRENIMSRDIATNNPQQMNVIDPFKASSPKANNCGQSLADSKAKDPAVFNATVGNALVSSTVKSASEAEKLVERVTEARAALEILVDQFKASWIEFTETGDERLKQLRMTRMATESEMRMLMASLREVRTFFLDSKHEAEVARLREFVDLCERLQKLKESGFLDSVADTMLRLSIK